MGGRYLSPATPHTKRRCIRERRATFPQGETGEGEGRAETMPAVTTPCSAAANVCRVASDSPREDRPIVSPPPLVAPCVGWGAGGAEGFYWGGVGGAVGFHWVGGSGRSVWRCGNTHGSAPSLTPCMGAWTHPPKICSPSPEGGGEGCGDNSVRGPPLYCASCMKGGSGPG